MRRGGARRARGQAVVETALGTLVFVTLCMVGIHFAEVGYLSLKVQEAANFGLWDVTNYPMHDTASGNWGYYTSAISRASTAALDRYQDYDSTTPSGASTVQLALTRAAPMQVTCATNGSIPYMNVNNLQSEPNAPGTVVRIEKAGYPQGDSGMGCTAQAALVGFGIPRFFMDRASGGFFKEQNWKPVSIRVCAAGRATGGSCGGQYGLLLDDWGYAGNAEGAECALEANGNTCANRGYYTMVQNVFNVYGAAGSHATALATFVSGGSPCNENAFWMSFRGSESGFTENLMASHYDVVWQTTPFDQPGAYAASYGMRAPCFLGLKC